MDPKTAIWENYERDVPFRMFDTRYIWGKIKARQLHYVLSEVGANAGYVLDLACGPGVYGVAIAKHSRVIGIDFAQNMVDAAQTFAESQGVGESVRFMRGDAEDIPFMKEQFDVVLFVDVSHHMTDDMLQTSISECHRVLKPGGILITDYKNSLNPALWLAYKIVNKPTLYLQSRTLNDLRRFLQGFRIEKKKGHGFPLGMIAPYRTLICRKEEHRDSP